MRMHSTTATVTLHPYLEIKRRKEKGENFLPEKRRILLSPLLLFF